MHVYSWPHSHALCSSPNWYVMLDDDDDVGIALFLFFLLLLSLWKSTKSVNGIVIIRCCVCLFYMTVKNAYVYGCK